MFIVTVCSDFFQAFLIDKKFDVETDNIALSQIFTTKDLSDLYSRWYYKPAQFAGMRIKHRKGRKMFCTDSLSRRRPVTEDDKEHFSEEPDRLFRLQSQLANDNAARTLLQSLQGETTHDTSTTRERTHNEGVPAVSGL